MNKPLFAIQYKQQGTTEKRAQQAAERRAAEAPNSPWGRLLTYFESQELAPIGFLLLASQRLTDLDISEAGADVGLDPWEALAVARAAELRLVRGGNYADRFNVFLEGFDGDEREQAVTVQDGCAMTYEEIGLRLGMSWQRVQQVEQQALAKLRRHMLNHPDEAFELLDGLGMSTSVAFGLTGVE